MAFEVLEMELRLDRILPEAINTFKCRDGSEGKSIKIRITPMRMQYEDGNTHLATLQFPPPADGNWAALPKIHLGRGKIRTFGAGRSYETPRYSTPAPSENKDDIDPLPF